MTIRLQVQDLCKTYAAPVLRDVNLNVVAGEIHALLGSNGAGKSTLSRIIAGLVMPTSGSMAIDGRPFAPRNKADAERHSVQIVQQELNLVDSLSVAENLFLNRLPHRLGFVRRHLLRDQARAVLDSLGLTEIDPDVAVRALGVGTRQLIEIAAALSRQCGVLILDEPTAALTASETARLFERLGRMKASGVSVIYITHRLDEVTAVCDRLTVLRDGCIVGGSDVNKCSTTEMVAMMTGDEPTQVKEFRSYRQTAVAMRVDGLHRPPGVRDVSFELKRGERLGITGLVGSGRTELLRTIFGADLADQGQVFLDRDDNSVAHRFTHPKHAVRRGIAMVTEDRKRDGLLLPQPIRVNLSLVTLPRFAVAGILRRRTERDACTRFSESLATKCDSIEQRVDELSGGNQQKIVIGKWLLRKAAVLLLDEPTRGIDVGSRHRVYQLIEAQAASGIAIVIVSSDLQELLDHCDAIAVMAGGRFVAKFERQTWSVAAITAACFEKPDPI